MTTQSPSLYTVLACRCPRCGIGKLYRGVLTITDQCSHCGLSLKEHEQGDGPAFFAVLIVGALSAGGAAVVQIKYQLPLWLDAVIWIPFILIGTVFSLRWLKALLIIAQYRLRKEDFQP